MLTLYNCSLNSFVFFWVCEAIRDHYLLVDGLGMKGERGKHCICTTISKLPTNVLPVELMFLKGYNAALTYQGEISSNHAVLITAVHSAGELS